MAQKILELEITANTDKLKKGLEDSKKALREFNAEASKSGLKDAMASERLEGVKLSNQLKANRLELSNLNLEKRKSQTQSTALAGSYREAQQRLTALGKSIREAEGGFNTTSPLIKRQISEYNELNNKLKEFDKTMGNNYRNVGNYKDAIGSILPSLSSFTTGIGLLGIGIAGASKIASSAYSAITKFDNGMKNVEKTTGLTRGEVQVLGDAFVSLSRKLQTTSAVTLTEYATVAGQLGVKGTENILRFSEALAKLATASNISGEQGGSEIARTLTLVDGGVQNIKAFGDEIVNLGNNFAATEKEILGNAESIAQNVGVYRIGRQEVLAFATATKAVGVEAELVGSTFNRTLAIFEKSIRTGGGLTHILKLLNTTQDELSTRFRNNASGVFVDFVSALNNIDKAGGSVKEQLENIGVDAVRDQKVIESLAVNGYDVLTSAMNTVRSSVGSLDAEHKTASEKIINQTNRMSVAWENFVLTIDKGEGAIGKFARASSGLFANMLDSLTDLSKGADNFWGKLELFSAFSPIAMIERAIDKGVKNADAASRGESQYMNDIVNSRSKWLDLSQKGLSISQEITSDEARRSAIAKEENAKREAQLARQRAIDAENEKKKGKGKKEKSQEELTLEAQQALLKLNTDNLRGIDKELGKIDNKWDDILKKIKDIKDLDLKASLALDVESGRTLDKMLATVDAFAKSKDIKGLTGRTSGVGLSGSLTVPNQLPNLERNQFIINARQRNNTSSTQDKDDAKLENRISKVIESGFRQGISSILGDITNLGSNFQQVFSNVFNNLAQSMSSILNNVIGTYLGDLFKKKLDDVKFLGFSNQVSKAIIAGLGTAGSLVSGLSSKTSSFGQGLGGALSGAAIGTSILPGIGTIVGGVLGGVAGIFGAKKARKERELQEAQLREQEKQTKLQERIANLTYTSSIVGQVTNQGVINAIDRDAFGNIVGRINGKDIVLSVDRTKAGS